MIGITLSHYRIVEELGRGGMGIVYKAEDTKLDRTVALKVLPAAALSSEDDRARFYREAKAAAQLNHPHIAAVHEIDEAVPEGAPSDDLRPFIAMEFIDGRSLEDTAKEGPMALEEVVRLTTQIAQALEAAHEKNIVHRDIKAANVMLTAKGQAKVLDFGLAKTAHSTMLTRMGSTLGTVAYMSPEQARGEDVDHRTDLWALGILMYELTAGRLPFSGDYEQAVTYSILNEDPQPLTAIRTGVPMGFEWIVSKLMAKKADDRYQSAKDLIVDLRTVDLTQQGLSRTTSVKSMPAAAPNAADKRIMAFNIKPTIWLAIVALVALGSWWIGHRNAPEPTEGSVKRVTQSVPLGGIVAAVDISSDGRYVALATDIIHVLDLALGQTRSYEVYGVYVFLDFSADGRRLLLTTATGIEILNLESGALVHVSDTQEGGPRAAWVDDNSIVYEEVPAIYWRSLTTSESRQIAFNDSLAGEYDMDYPSTVRDGTVIMTTVQRRDGPDRVGFFDLASSKRLAVLDLEGTRFQYVDPGYLVFIRNANLMAVPFDLDRLEVTGPVIPLAEGVRVEGMALSDEGTLVHAGLNVGAVSNARPTRPVVTSFGGATFSNESKADQFPAAIYRSAAVHPSGNLAAVVIEGEPQDRSLPPSDVWILDFQTGSRRAVTNDGVSDYPTWNATGDSLYIIKRPDENVRTIVRKSLTGRGNEEIILPTGNTELADFTVSPDGRWAIAATGIPPLIDSQSEFVLIDLGTVSSLDYRLEWERTNTGANGNPRMFDFSPDSRFVAYEDQGGIYVQSVEDPGVPPYLIWENGKTLPKWSADGSYIYALDVDSGGERIEVQLEPGFSTLGPPEDLSDYWYAFGTGFFEVFPESDRFLMGYPASDLEGNENDNQPKGDLPLHFIFDLVSELSKDQ